MEELLLLSQQLDFRDLKAVPIISASRWLVKRGDAVKVCLKDGGESAKLTFGRRVQKTGLVLVLLTDLLIIGKRKGVEKVLVQDYCPRNMVQVSDTHPITGLCEPGSFPLWLTLLNNHENKTQELLIVLSSSVERCAWIDLLTPNTAQVDGEKIYEGWDCPKVEAIVPYTPESTEELALEPADTAKVLKKSQDGCDELTEMSRL